MPGKDRQVAQTPKETKGEANKGAVSVMTPETPKGLLNSPADRRR